MEIKILDAERYAGQRFTACYQTNGYYDISATESGFQIEYKAFEAPVNKSFEDVFFGQWLDDPIAYGAFENGRLLGYVEGFRKHGITVTGSVISVSLTMQTATVELGLC